MDKKISFKEEFVKYFDVLLNVIATGKNEWIVKGFIDIYKKVYPMTSDTKVISKIIELMIYPEIIKFAQKNHYKIVLAEHQNHYPDLTFINENSGEIYAVDIKSSYRIDENTINGMTLGAFTGYFRQRDSTKNISMPYSSYNDHFVLGVIYNRDETSVDAFNKETKSYELKDLLDIKSVASGFKFFLQEKWRIASDKPGSGNTKNIGSTKNIKRLIEGKGQFSSLGKDVFDDYWMNYLTNDMAKAIDSEIPFHNIIEYLKWKQNIDFAEIDIHEITSIQNEDSRLDNEIPND